MINPNSFFRHIAALVSVFIISYNARAQLTFTVSNPGGSYSLTCNNPTFTLYASSSYPGPVTYVWNNSTSSISSSSVNITTPAYYTVTATSGPLTAQQTFTVWNNLNPPAITPSGQPSILSCVTPSTSVQISSVPSAKFFWGIKISHL